MLLEHGVPLIWVEAEISNFSRPGSGHWYFTLKDRDAQLRCAMFRQKNSLVRIAPKEGQLVLVRGRVGLYEPRGDYQLIAEHMEDAGVGALQREFERLKDKLAAEGLFAQERKRALPSVPQRIGVVTSPTGAAIRDILNVLRRRFPAASVLIYPTAVQGAAAAPEIAAAITLASARAEVDVLIVARGGGSIEDLWAFNDDERVARAIAAAPMPVVSGVGHEVDFTIADFVADLRAPTPSGAAELVVPDAATWRTAFAQLHRRFAVAVQRQLRDQVERLTTLRQRLRQTDPRLRLEQHAQRLDELEQRLARASSALLRECGSRLQRLQARLAAQSPATRMAQLRSRTAILVERLNAAAVARLREAQHRVALLSHSLNAISPLATLSRGFAIVTAAESGALLRDAAGVASGTEIDARLAVGTLRAVVR